MKINKSFLYAILSMVAISSLVACGKSHSNNSNNTPDEEEERELEIGDTVKEWKSSKDSATLPLDVAEGGTGTREIAQDFGNQDEESLHYSVKSNSGYLTTEMSNPYFQEFDAKNGDIISLFVYIPSNNNLKSLELELNSIPYGGSGWGNSGTPDTIKGTKIEVNSEKENKWIRLEHSYDTLYNLGSIRLNFVAVDADQNVEFYVDDINITLGEETVETKYTTGESLYKKYEDNFLVGTCMSMNMLRNSEYRRIAKEQFNSITAENEGKPENVLDKTACQELAKTDETAVAITTTQFEKIYDWCEANHIKVRHHTFVWHQQTPGWFFNKGYQDNGQQVSKEVMLGRLDNYFKVMIETLDERWPELVYALDVVNEAIEEVDQIRTGNWLNTVGDDYIYQAFASASKYKKDYQELYYNDYAFEQTQWHGKERCQWAVDTMLKKAINEELIDGIGIQSHIDFSDLDTVLDDARIICKAGLKCQITELDINCGEQNSEEQKEVVSRLIKTIVEENDAGTMNINAVVVWGITDNLSWHYNMNGRTNYPLLFNEDFSKKPAYYGFLEALEDL